MGVSLARERLMPEPLGGERDLGIVSLRHLARFRRRRIAVRILPSYSSVPRRLVEKGPPKLKKRKKRHLAIRLEFPFDIMVFKGRGTGAAETIASRSTPFRLT